MNNDVGGLIIIGLIIIMSLYYPNIAIIFLTLTFVITLIQISKPVNNNADIGCTKCTFYDKSEHSCMYRANGKIIENCEFYMERE